MDDVSAHDVCHELLHHLRLSNLHFALSETPHSVQIMLRKRYLNGSKGPVRRPNSNFQDYENVEDPNKLLSAENDELREKLETSTKSSKETVNILEQKVSKI